MGKHRFVAVLVALPLLAAAGFALAGFALAGSVAAPQKSYLLKANLSAGQETPPVKGAKGATGLFTATLTASGSKGALAWRLTFRNLTGRALAAHIHIGAPGKPGPVAIPLCGPCSSGAHGVFRGPLSGNSALVKALLHGGAYTNVHTKKNPNGEIRGTDRVTGTTTKPVATAGTTTTPPPTSTGYGY
jgi:hypothetical protein